MTPEQRLKMREALLKHHREHPETGERISATKRRQSLEAKAGPIESPTHKKCPSCNATKPLSEFYSGKRKKLKCGLISVYPDCWCKDCRNEHRRAGYKRRKQEDPKALKAARKRGYENEDAEKRRIRNREWLTAKRREEGLIERGPRVKAKGNEQRFVSPAPLARFLASLPPREIYAAKQTSETLERRMLAVEKEEWPTLNLSSVDQILLALGCPEQMNILYPLEEEKLVGYQILDPDGVLER